MAYEGWAIVEVMGHRRVAGYVREEEQYGTKMLRIDVPQTGPDGPAVTQYYSGASIYALHPTTQEAAFMVASKRAAPPPVSPWEFPQLEAPSDDDIPL